MELHGFADASEWAYAGAVYLRVPSGEDIRVTLLLAKTRVDPLNHCHA